jgi:hypothetical protein
VEYKHLTAVEASARIGCSVSYVYRLGPLLGEYICGATVGGYLRRLYRSDLVDAYASDRFAREARSQALKHERMRLKRPRGRPRKGAR